ncbi:MAG: GAF domain-containing protein [Cyanobacteriota bacterium]|nr:GAF domain-containing protein [Cyanobacteriota bacterium]
MTTYFDINSEQKKVNNNGSDVASAKLPERLSEIATTAEKLKTEIESSRTLKENQYVQALVQKLHSLAEIAIRERPQHEGNGGIKMAREKLGEIVRKISQPQNLEAILQVTAGEVRESLQAERVIIYQLDQSAKNSSRLEGKVVAESILPGILSCQGSTIPAISFVPEQRSPIDFSPLAADTNGDWKNYEDNSQTTLNRSTPLLAFSDLYQAGISPYQRQLLERFQTRAQISQAILIDGKLWGLLIAQQCSSVRQWEEPEIYLLSQIALELTIAIQSSLFRNQLQKQTEIDRSVTQVIEKIRQSLDIETIFKTTTNEVRSLLQADRVAVYQFMEDWDGEFVAESVAPGWINLVVEGRSNRVKDTNLRDTQGGRYARGESYAVDDIYKIGHDPCHVQLLEQFQARAYMLVPVFQGQKLWGILAAYQNSGPRKWQGYEVKLLEQIGRQLGLATQQGEYFQQLESQARELAGVVERDRQAISLQEEATSRDRVVSRVVERFLQNQELEAIFSVTVREIRSLLDADRVGVFRFYPDAGFDDGEFVAEDVLPGYSSAKAVKIHDHCFGEQYASSYRDGRIQSVADIYNAGLSDCHIDVLSQFQVRANLIVPMLKDGQLWGLLCVHQCRGPRDWEDDDVAFIKKVASQFSVGLQQAEYLEQIQSKSQKLAEAAERERSQAQIIDKIRQTLNVEEIFQVTVQEVRRLLKSDRVGVFKFNPDWSGQFIMESVGGGWVKLVNKTDIKNLRENILCENLQSLVQAPTKIDDTYLQDTKGAKYRKKKYFASNDVYNSGFPDCYIQLLEQFEAKAYISVPIMKGGELWGLLATYQNSNSREWEEGEITLMTQIANQLGIALQQADYLQQLEEQSEQLSKAAEREKKAKEQLQQGAIQLLSTVAPVLQGDLTVRAVITEDEVGTIADAYNNTIQSLRQLVMQLKTAAEQVAQTSKNSEVSIVQLSTKAQQQFEEIDLALKEIQEVAGSTMDVTNNAQQVTVAVERANRTVKEGEGAMNRTVKGILAIRKTVLVARERIKRLSESSQNISKVVSLISNFATQTNLLALNAALEATRAGEYGKGFAVVADEVRSLARQSAAATAEIEELVEEIQTETSQVATAMEMGIRQVVKGNQLVDETRESLNAIIASTAQITQLVKSITEATGVQNERSQSVTKTMTNVAGIANTTSEDAIELAASFKELLALAEALQTSVGQFKV